MATYSKAAKQGSKRAKNEGKKYQVGGANTKPANPDDQSAFDWAKSYLASNKYKERLGNFYQHPDLVQQQRLNYLKGTTFSNDPSAESSSYGGGNMTIANNEFTSNTLQAARSQYSNPKLTINRGATVVHELGHGANADSNPTASLRMNPLEQKYIFDRNKELPASYKQGIYDMINKNKKNNTFDTTNPANSVAGYTRVAQDHDSDPTENLSDVQAVRFLANKYKLYDARTQDLTPEVLQKIKSDPRIQNELHGSRLFNRFDDKALLDIFNKVAYNNPGNQPGQNMAQVGGDLQYAQNGPDLPTLQNPANQFNPVMSIPSNMPNTPRSSWRDNLGKVDHAVEGGLKLADYIGSSINDAKEKRHYEQDYIDALKGKPKYNPNEKGVDNIPIISKNGGEMNVFDYPYKKGKYFRNGGRYMTMDFGSTSWMPKKQKGGSVDYAFMQDPTPYPSWAKPQSNMDMWGFEQGGVNYNRADTIGSFFPAQYFMDGGPVDYQQATGLDGLYQKGGNLSASKAKQMLKDGTAQGKPLTPAQKRYFGWVAGGGKPQAKHGGIPWPDVGYHMPSARVGGTPGWINESDGVDGIYMDGGPIDYNQATGLDAIFCLGGGYTDFDQAIGLDGIYARGGYITPGRRPGMSPIDDYNFSQGLDGIYANGGYIHPGYLGGGTDDYTQATGLDAMYKKGGIHIKKANKGKFTEYKQRTGKTTEQALHSKDPHVRQMANFAKNAKKWHHQFGGYNYGPAAFTPLIDAHQNGGQGGGYNVGDVLDLTPDQIEHLQSQGYDFQLMDNPYSIR